MLCDREAISHVSIVIKEWRLQMWPHSHHETGHPWCDNSDLLTTTFILKHPMSHRHESLQMVLSQITKPCAGRWLYLGATGFLIVGLWCFLPFLISSLALTTLPLLP